jgi:hypothetical protein
LPIRVGDLVFAPAVVPMGALCKEGIDVDDKAPDFVVELVFVPQPGRDGTPAEVLADLPTACLLTTPPARGEKKCVRIALCKL